MRRLHACGWLHNHARLWLASYLVHGRKVHWRCGADWLYAHLLDGDLASNHLSWQWVAGTASSKPYLFNAENVARHAPPDWHSAGTPIDRSYEELDRIARTPGATIDCLPRGEGIEPPALHAAPPEGFGAPDPHAVQGRVVWIVHPWSLADPPDDLPGDAVRIGIAIADRHARWPWSARRWRFVSTRMRALCSRPQDRMWFAPMAALAPALRAAAVVRCIDDPHLDGALAPWAPTPPPRLFQDPPRRCTSFSQFWDRAKPVPADPT